MVFQLVLQFCSRILFAFISKVKQLVTTLPEDLQLYSEVLQKYVEDPSVQPSVPCDYLRYPYTLLFLFPSLIILLENELHMLLICPCSTSLSKSFRILSPAYFVLTFPQFCTIREFHHLTTYSFFQTTDMLHKFNKIGANNDS